MALRVRVVVDLVCYLFVFLEKFERVDAALLVFDFNQSGIGPTKLGAKTLEQFNISSACRQHFLQHYIE